MSRAERSESASKVRSDASVSGADRKDEAEAGANAKGLFVSCCVARAKRSADDE